MAAGLIILEQQHRAQHQVHEGHNKLGVADQIMKTLLEDVSPVETRNVHLRVLEVPVFEFEVVENFPMSESLGELG